jgi:hypothetical protein
MSDGIPKHDTEELLGGPEIVKELVDRGFAHHSPHSPEAPASLKATPLDVTMMAIVQEGAVVAAGKPIVVWSVNEDGYSVVHAHDPEGPVAMPTVPDGRIRAMSISADGSVLVLLMSTPGRAAEVVAARPGTSEATWMTRMLWKTCGGGHH